MLGNGPVRFQAFRTIAAFDLFYYLL